MKVEHIHKGGKRPESFYSFITSRFISRPIVPILIKLGIKNPNTITILSFIILVSATIFILISRIESAIDRIIISVLIEVSFILDCSDGQMARLLNKASLFGGWLDKYLDRVGEMFLYSSIGYVTWLLSGNLIYFILGIFSGFMFSYYSLIWAIKDSVFLEEIKNNDYDFSIYKKPVQVSEERINRYEYKSRKIVIGKRVLKKSVATEILSDVFFFLNIGMGERYFYPILFILINKTNFMLYIVSLLIFLRSMNVTIILKRQILNNKVGIKLD